MAMIRDADDNFTSFDHSKILESAASCDHHFIDLCYDRFAEQARKNREYANEEQLLVSFNFNRNAAPDIRRKKLLELINVQHTARTRPANSRRRAERPHGGDGEAGRTD